MSLWKREQILYKAIKKLLQDDKLREKYAKIGLERAKDFDIEKISQEWENLINDLVKR